MKIKNLAVIICLLLMSTLSACSSDYSESIEINWGISLPKGYEELFSVDSGASFHGDGDRYHVFSYKEELKQSEIEKFSSEKNPYVEDEVEKILNSLQVSNEQKPDFSKEYYWYRKNGDNDSRNKLYLIYFNEDNILHVIEQFY
ncbi:hypothetical protein KQI88_10595 [Alkaliphilus sp. MSJ-5]|uniref:Lipoprotein n=1 Tax=Alkaliphilus flagellatus TaxID=2841507 RepID=A0ABS6G302_9FIRM|nr:hypothetical protein [Alkaliphilus flagellatus]MBU5676866.1 hypothetical protein [Alkaliphilus flagellatus]